MKNIAQQRFGKLTAVAAIDKYQNAWRWRCRCDCGQVVIVRGPDLRRGMTKSCGCLQRETIRLRVTIHGAIGTAEYMTWDNMMQRCYNPNHPGFKNYGDRGIEVCKRWYDFRNFFADMGLRPTGRYSIERVDVNGNYEPSNCIWLPLSEQNKNTRRTKNNRKGD